MTNAKKFIQDVTLSCKRPSNMLNVSFPRLFMCGAPYTIYSSGFCYILFSNILHNKYNQYLIAERNVLLFNQD